MQVSPETGFPKGVWLAGAGAMLLIGWGFILFQNNFHLTPPVVFVCLGYGAGVAAVYTLFRTGASAMAGNEESTDDASWGRPVGARGELEREKRALLKAIKEAEFDQQMGKLSKVDAEAMIATFRAQAIEVIKEIDRKEGNEATARAEIELEVKARLELAKTKKVVEDKKAKGKGKGKAGKASEPAAKAEAAKAKVEVAKPAPEPEATEAAAATDDHASDDHDDDDDEEPAASPASEEPSAAAMDATYKDPAATKEATR